MYRLTDWLRIDRLTIGLWYICDNKIIYKTITNRANLMLDIGFCGGGLLHSLNACPRFIGMTGVLAAYIPGTARDHAS
jgi:hypothetical protein